MARDPKRVVARAQFTCANIKGGRISNDFAFEFGGTVNPTVSDWNALTTAVENFYNSHSGTGTNLNTFLSPQLDRSANASEVAIYQIDVLDPAHYFGSPVHVTPFTLGGPAPGAPLPAEVACVFSIRGDYGTNPEHLGRTRPRASDRGRVFVGPLGTNCINSFAGTGTTKYPILDFSLVGGLPNVAQKLKTDAQTANWIWSVWSRKLQVFTPVIDYAVDSEPDTQRRRGNPDPLQSWVPFT